MNFIKNLLKGDEGDRFLKRAFKIVKEINLLEEELEKLEDEELKLKTEKLKDRLEEGETLDDVLVEAFSLVREAAKRTLNQRHYDVQLVGGIALHEGRVAEMKTGEGKTLASTLPVYLNALKNDGVHVVTVNDYLARRDAVWMGQIYNLLGLSVGCLSQEGAYLYDETFKEEEVADEERDITGSFKIVDEFLRPSDRKSAYGADITYGTNNEFGFDYLRDNLVMSAEQAVQRSDKEGGWNFVIIDEVDSILIDEARTPLIISRPDEESGKLYQKFSRIAPKLKKEEDYTVDEKMKAVSLTQQGIDRVEKLLGVKDIYQEGGLRLVHHLEEALKAEILFKRDRDYVVRPSDDGGEVVIVDAFTGRLMPGRRYSEGLHQAIEAKERVKVQKESRTVATITFQNYFRKYKKVAGMTGTAVSSSEELFKVYGLEVVVVPTHKPLIRKELPDRVYKSEDGKLRAIAREVKKINQSGRPILLGTVSIEHNERLSSLLNQVGVEHRVLNAKNHEKEAEIIAQAGKLRAVTVATNMAGRGVDIILGGNPPSKEEAEKVKESGGLHVIGTERHEARRIDDQLRGRAGRQGDPGSSQFFVSLEDDLMRVFGGDKVKTMMNRLKIPEDEPIQSGIITKAIESAQSRIEGYHFDIRKHVLEYDEVINKQREKIYAMRREFIQQDSDVKIKEEVSRMMNEEVEELVYRHSTDTGDFNKETLWKDLQNLLPLSGEEEEKFKLLIDKSKSPEEAEDKIKNKALEVWNKKEEDLGEKVMRVLERSLLLRLLDELWMEHLESMQYIKTSVGLRAYGQRDPLVEYKKESHRLFKDLLASLRTHTTALVFRAELSSRSQAPSPTQNIQLQGPAKKAQGATQPAKRVKPGGKKIGRNDPCPCGSGKKWKKCGLKNTAEHQRNLTK